MLSSLLTTDDPPTLVESDAKPSVDHLNYLRKNHDHHSSIPLPRIHHVSHQSESDNNRAVLKTDLAVATSIASRMRKRSVIHEQVACLNGVLSVIEPSSHVPNKVGIQEKAKTQSQLNADPNGSTITSLIKRVKGGPRSSSPDVGDGMVASNISISSISSLS